MPFFKRNYISDSQIVYKCDVFGSMIFKNLVFRKNKNKIKTKNGDLKSVYIRTIAIPNFIRNVLPKIETGIVLVTGGADQTLGDSSPEMYKNSDLVTKEMCDTLLTSPKIIHWFGQNGGLIHTKFTPIPIGLSYNTKNKHIQDREIQRLQQHMTFFSNRKMKCYANFHFKLTKDRTDALNNINKKVVYYEPHPVDRLVSFQNQSQYAFVISPTGTGYDCYRTWEALVLGCIPILKHSIIDNVFLHLPVLLIDNWSDITHDLLVNTVEKFKNTKFNYDKLKLSYWENEIRNKLNTY